MDDDARRMSTAGRSKLPFLYSVLALYVVGLLVMIGHVGLLASRERQQMSSALVHAQAEVVAERVATVVAENSLSHDDRTAMALLQRLQAERPDLLALRISWPDGTSSTAGEPGEGIRIRRELSLGTGDAPLGVEVSVRPSEPRLFSAVDAWLLLTFLVAALLGTGVCIYMARRFRQIHRVMDGLEAQRSMVASIQGADEFAELGRRLVRVFHPWNKPRRRVGTLPRFLAPEDRPSLSTLPPKKVRVRPVPTPNPGRPSHEVHEVDDGDSGVMSLFDVHSDAADPSVRG